ncbi:MAG TPA: type IV toxin-antitoxin system AbiEi family antitoxin domain-containing protein, partial [Acidimicrobiia bacterium]
MSDAELTPIARRQYGLLTTRQALTSLTTRQLRRRLRDGRLERVRRGVYRVGGVPESWHQKVLAACLAAGPNARASFRSAAALYELEGFATGILEVSHLG